PHRCIMAKTEKTEPRSSPPPSSPAPARAAASPPSAQLMGAYWVIKLLAIVAGFPLAMLSVMALIGALTDNGFVRVIGAVAVLLVPPLVIADRLLPDDPKKAQGLVTDVLAICWVLIAFAIAGVGGTTTKPMLSNEGDRLVRSGYPELAKITYLLGGVSTDIPQ